MKHTIRGISLALCALVSSIGSATVASSPSPASPAQFITHHQIAVHGVKISFTATAGETYLYDDAGNLTGSVFSYGYVKDGTAPRRPVLFLIGGGPGASSNSLNVGFVGPWTVAVERLTPKAERRPAPVPPFELSENHDSLLDTADLVFIDPIGTGYSRALGNASNEDFWGLDEDLDSLAQFIQLWLSKNGRWNSPKFFLGESYGGTRAAIIPDILLGGPSYPGYLRGITLNGVIVMSNGFGFGLGADGLSPELQAATVLPNHAAAAWYHNKVEHNGRTFEQFYEEVSQFALGDYLSALQHDAAKVLSSSDRQAIVNKLSAYTGLSPVAYAGSLVLSEAEFAKLLLADKGLMVSTYDSRFVLPMPNAGVDPVADDPLLNLSFPVYTGALMDEEHSKLDVQMNRPYVAVHWRDLLAHWNYAHRPSWLGTGPDSQAMRPKRFATNAEELAVSMNRNPTLSAMVVTGYFDGGTSPAQAKYATERAGIPKDRLILENVMSGHEPYVDGVVMTSLINDIRSMIRTVSR